MIMIMSRILIAHFNLLCITGLLLFLKDVIKYNIYTINVELEKKFGLQQLQEGMKSNFSVDLLHINSIIALF